MSTAVAMAPSPAPLDRPPSYASDGPEPSVVPASIGSSSSIGSTRLASVSAKVSPMRRTTTMQSASTVSDSDSVRAVATLSPSSSSRLPASIAPRIVIKNEPSSPDTPPVPAPTRHRPRKLDLTQLKGNNGIPQGPATARTASREGLGIQEVGLACLSPGFVTDNPLMREQLQRSMTVREHQRHIIESRLHQQSGVTESPLLGNRETRDGNSNGSNESSGYHASIDSQFPAKTPGLSRRNKGGLSIIAPSSAQFANERVIQSAPLGQTFTGCHQPPLVPRYNSSASISNSVNFNPPVHHANNRLPPIIDVLSQGLAGHPDGALFSGKQQPQQHPNPTLQPAPQQMNLLSPPLQGNPPSSNANSMGGHLSSNSNTPAMSISASSRQPPTLPSPGISQYGSHPQHFHHGPESLPYQRPRDYKSAEEAQVELAGGRPELLPKLVHYGGQQPPTPPSPLLIHNPAGMGQGYHSIQQQNTMTAGAGRRRTRAEFEEGGSPPHLGPPPRRGPFESGRDSPETQRHKREEFMRICERLWDLLQS